MVDKERADAIHRQAGSAWIKPDAEARIWLGLTIARRTLGIRPGILPGLDPPGWDVALPRSSMRKASENV